MGLRAGKPASGVLGTTCVPSGQVPAGRTFPQVVGRIRLLGSMAGLKFITEDVPRWRLRRRFWDEIAHQQRYRVG